MSGAARTYVHRIESTRVLTYASIILISWALGVHTYHTSAAESALGAASAGSVIRVFWCVPGCACWCAYVQGRSLMCLAGGGRRWEEAVVRTGGEGRCITPAGPAGGAQ